MRATFSSIALCGCLLGCEAPALQNAPRPDPSVVAAAAAAVAGAATVAAPDAAAKKAEQATADPNKPRKTTKVKETVPSDVFDRLDAKRAAAPAPAPPPPP